MDKIREAQNKSREQIAESTDISTHFLFEIETGRKSIKSKTIINLAKALNFSTDFILLQTCKKFQSFQFQKSADVIFRQVPTKNIQLFAEDFHLQLFAK